MIRSPRTSMRTGPCVETLPFQSAPQRSQLLGASAAGAAPTGPADRNWDASTSAAALHA
jgi:hypothetical protein